MALSTRYLMESAPGPETLINGQRYLYFGGTSYYGLHHHPDLMTAGIETWKAIGTNTATSRDGMGTAPVHVQVETAASKFFATEDAAYLASGYLNNTAGVQALHRSGAFDIIFVDEHAHYCVHDAARTTGARIHRFSHRSPEDLNWQLSQYLRPGQTPLVMSDGLFPGLGKIAPLGDYLALLEPYGGLIWLDDAHAAGVLGPHGRGSADYFCIDSDRVFAGATLAKAFGGFGGIVSGSAQFIATVRSGPTLVAATAPPSPLAAASAVGLELVLANPQWRHTLWDNARLLKNGLCGLGLDIDETEVPIAAFALESQRRMQQVHQQLMEKNIAIQLHKYPGGATSGMLRMVVFSTHSKQQIGQLIDALSTVL